MRQKLGTAIEPRLLYRARLLAAHEKKHLNTVIEEALEQYLRRKKKAGSDSGSVVRSTKGSIPANADLVKKVLEEGAFFEI